MFYKAFFLFMTSICLFFEGESARAGCNGTVIDPITAICWKCIFPIKVGKVRLSSSGINDPITDASPVCACSKSGMVPIVAGINLSFFEPVRTVEIVREPYCFPSLGGIQMNVSHRAPAHGRSSSRGSEGGRHTAFYQAHWYQTPWLFVLEALFDTTCLEQSPWDLAYMTELDPFWDDALASFVIAPESALFANPMAVAACASDCAAASLGSPLPQLFWCNGCQGSLYPLSGWIASMTSPLQAWHLLAARMSVKLAREGLLWATYGKNGQCGPYFEPIPRKDVWRTELVYPSTESTCHPLGASTQIWGMGKSYPIKGEDGAVLLWRMRDCCQSVQYF